MPSILAPLATRNARASASSTSASGRPSAGSQSTHKDPSSIGTSICGMETTPMNWIQTAVLGLLSGCFKVVKPSAPLPDPPAPGAFPHEIFDGVLQKYVSP